MGKANIVLKCSICVLLTLLEEITCARNNIYEMQLLRYVQGKNMQHSAEPRPRSGTNEYLKEISFVFTEASLN